jgi:hypothetical protein
MKSQRTGWRAAIFLAGALLVGWQTKLDAQEARGTIVGQVADASGAVIPNAPVTVTNQAMGTKTSLVTNEVGLYQAPYLIPGLYQITVEVPGFKKFVRDGVEVRVNDRIEVNISLEVGAAEQSVTVTGETPLLSTATASLGQVVDGRRIAEMPIPHGNPYFLIGLAAGVTFNRDPRLDRPFEPTHIVGYSMDGTRANRSDVTMDGAPSTATANPGEVISSYVPPADIVAEFKVQTATFDASFGQTEGGVTNISLKAGTNNLHGTGYWTKMAPGLFANDYFANANRIPKADFTYDRWGASGAGPVWLPKLYDGRNKTFFMWGYEGIHESRPRNNGIPTVPTEAMKSGDFSALLRLGANYQIYNPFTRRAVAGGRYQQDPFANNIIPASLHNPVAKNIFSYYANPRTAGNPDGTSNYQRPELVERAKYYTHTGRVDHVISDKQRIFVRGSVYRRDSTYNNYFDNLATGQFFQFFARSGVIDDVYTLNPTTVLNVRYGYNRFIRADAGNPEAHGFDLTTLGFPKAYNDAISPDIRRFPRIEITGYQGTGVAGEYRPNDTHSINATVQKARGEHFLKTGMEFRAYRETRRLFANEQTGRFNFDATWTRGPLDNSPTAPGQLGQSVASFLLGLPAFTNSYVQRAATYAEQSTSWGFFVHDDWKVTPKLTLNLGLRWEFEGPLTERFNRSVSGFDFSAAQPIEAAVRARYAANPTPEIPASQFRVAGGLLFAGPHDRGLYNTPKRNLMPRVGLAYRLNDKTVVRTGYGIFYGFLGQRRGDVVQTGFSRATPVIPTRDNGLSFIATLSNPFPDGILEPVGAALGTQTFLGQSVTFFHQNPLMPYMQRWQLGIQRELGGGFVLETSYVGNRGTHIEINQNLNVTPQQYLSRSPVRDNTTINYLSANLPNPFAGQLPADAVGALTGTTIARERLLRPYPHFDAVNSTRYDGYSWYHSLQFQLEKRFSKGYTLNAGYTFSKFMQATEVLNQDDPRPTEVVSDFDRPHRLVVSGIYEFPFGRGRRFGGDLNPVASRIISGWQVSGIYTFQSGAPLGWGNIIYYSPDIGAIRLPSDQQTVARWFNTGAPFERNSALQLDRNVRTFPLRFGFLRADNTNNFDLSVLKNTRVAEGKDIQFKAEFLNALNHPLFPAPNTTPSAATFGLISASTQANYPRRIQLTVKFLF